MANFFFFYQHWWNKISMLMRRYPSCFDTSSTREKKEKITMEFPSLCPRPNNEKQSYWTSDYALTLLNRYYASCDCGGQHGCEWNYAWNANAICWIFSHDSRENSLRLLDKSLRETRDDDFSMLIDDECCSVRRVILLIFYS